MSPDHQCLFNIADTQHGYFTSAQAQGCGFSNALIRHHTGMGRYIRIRRGLYRLQAYPTYYRDDVVAAWLSVGKEKAVVSHESALELHELSDVVPRVVHLTASLRSHVRPQVPGARLHTTKREWLPGEVRYLEGIPVTSPERSIVDSAEAGTSLEQIEMAVDQALRRRITTPSRLRNTSSKRSARVRTIIEEAITLAEATSETP